MKKWILSRFVVCALSFLGANAVRCQTVNTTQTTSSASPPDDSQYTIVAQDANSRVWQRVLPIGTNDQGQVKYITNSYTEISSGLNHLVNGQWVQSSDNIQVTPGGGVATNGQHQVGFAANINTSNAVEIITADNLELKTHILGLSYFDTSIQSNILIAQLTNSTGTLVNSNQVLYPAAFTDVNADVRYTYTISGFDQDIIIREQMPSPTAYGLSPSTTWLQIWTEFLDSPVPNGP